RLRSDNDSADRAGVQPHPAIRRLPGAEHHSDQNRPAHFAPGPRAQVYHSGFQRDGCQRTVGLSSHHLGTRNLLLASARTRRSSLTTDERATRKNTRFKAAKVFPSSHTLEQMPLSCPPSRLRGLRFEEPRFFPVDENGLSSFPGVKPFVVFSFHLRRFFKAFLGGIEDVLRLITPLEIWNAVQGFSLVFIISD